MRRRTLWTILWMGVITLSYGRLSAQEHWVYRYDGPASGEDEAYSIVMGTDGNLYAAGVSWGSGTERDFTVISLTPSGGERWVYRYNGPGNYLDWANSIVMGADGNLYAAGRSRGSGTSDDFIVISLAPSGGERWVYRYNGPANSVDVAYSIVMGTDGNLYAAGGSWGSGTSGDFTVISLTPSGGERWVYSYNGPASSGDVAYSIVVATDNNLYAAGYSWGSGTLADFTVISLAPSGLERWVYRYNGPENDLDWAHSIVTGTDGNLYVAGWTYGSGTDYDFTVISLTPSGTQRWVYRYNGPGNVWDIAKSIVVGTDGNLYTAGYSWGSGTGYDFTVISLTPSGDERWVYRYNGPGNGHDWATSIATGADSNLYAAGRSEGSGTDYDFTVISLTPSGGERWVYRHNGPGNGEDVSHSVAAGTDGYLYAAGWSYGSGTDTDFTVISLWLPAVGLVTGGGWIPGDPPGTGSKRTFGFNVRSEAGGTWGQLQFNDHETKMKVHSDTVTTLVIQPGDTVANFLGDCRVDGLSGYRFECEVMDRGEPGRCVDKFSIDIYLPDGNLYYSAGDFLGGGNIQIHTAPEEGPDPDPNPPPETEEGTKMLPVGQGLFQNSPNPFGSSTVISYQLPSACLVTLNIYNLTGKLVTTLVNGSKPAGHYSVEWNGKDSSGREVSTGIYVYRLTGGDFTATKKILVLR